MSSHGPSLQRGSQHRADEALAFDRSLLDAASLEPAPEPARWAIAAPFTLDPAKNRWLVPYVPPCAREFSLVPARTRSSWHDRATVVTGVSDWASAWSQGNEAWSVGAGGVITVFPPLAVVVGLHQRSQRIHRPVVAWCFNLGALYGPIKRSAARVALARIDRIVVHSRAEMVNYAQWLDMELDRFRFVPLQRAQIPIVEAEDEARPFVLAMGSARRDYATLFEAVRRSKLPTLVVAARHALEGLEIPANVEVRTSLSSDECRRLAQRARVNVVPVLNEATASGQVTLVEAMRMGRAIVATDCIGSEDYIESEVNGLLVPAQSALDLGQAIERLWDDASLRQRLGRNAARFSAEHCSDEAAGTALAAILDELRV